MLIPIGAGLVLVSDLIGNLISFKHRIYNALITAVVWCVVFVALDYIYAMLDLKPAELVPPDLLLKWTAAGIVFAFAADLIGNHISFDNRIVNSLITAAVWAVLFFVFLMIVGY
jgi:ABC-type enterochelin transport system permease subunit